MDYKIPSEQHIYIYQNDNYLGKATFVQFTKIRADVKQGIVKDISFCKMKDAAYKEHIDESGRLRENPFTEYEDALDKIIRVE